MKQLLVLAAALLAAMPAWADTTAVYKAPQGAQMTIEVASNGNMRSTIGSSGTYSLSVDGEDYMVFYDANGPVVVRMSDMVAVLADYVQKNMPELAKASEAEGPSPFKYFRGGQMTIGGRAGTIWYMNFGEDSLPPDKFAANARIVVSADPELAELGAALVRQIESSTKLSSPLFGRRNPADGILEVVKTGAPILWNGMELTSVSRIPIAADRFALPAKPETLEQVRTRFEANGGHIP